MAEIDDPGKLLFSFDINDCSEEEYLKMGRAIQLRNSRKLALYSAAAAVVCVGLSIALSWFIAVIALAIVIEALVYTEYSSRNIASKIKTKGPIHYDFHEDGLTETVGDSESVLIWYNEIREVKRSKSVFTLVCKKAIVVVPRSLVDGEAEKLLGKLRSPVAANRVRPSRHR